MIRKTQDTRRKTQDKSGFSLTEVLLAVGTLAVGMLFVACVFPVSIRMTTVSSERTIAAVAAEEAFAKIKLNGFINFSGLSDVNQNLYSLPIQEFAYPSTPTDPDSKKFWWSALCRRVDANNAQVTVFVSRKTPPTAKYYIRDTNPPFTFLPNIDVPVAVFVSVRSTVNANELQISDVAGVSNFINDGCTIVDDATGRIYRVLERYPTAPNVIRLDRDWAGLPQQRVWTIPAPVSSTSTRYPCIAVYQKVMRF